MKVLLIGGLGKMGREMQSFMKQNNVDFFAVDKQNFDECFDVDFDVVVDFSNAESLKQNLDLATKKQTPILVATTNHNKTNECMLKLASKKIAVAICPNLSIGVMCVSKMLEQLTPINSYDFVLTETHHKQKKDAPSGTAKQFIKILSNQGITPQIVSVRAGKIVGEHTISAIGENEIIEIKHTALSRDCFCFGAIEVCKKLITKQAGLYTIKDLL